jgi:hypothetical protein
MKVGTATRLRVGQLRNCALIGGTVNGFSLVRSVQTALGAHSLIYYGYRGFYPEGKAAGACF